MDGLLSVAAIVYVGFIFALAIFAKGKVRNETDFLAAGRRLPTFFASATLFATWFGAGTILTATDAIYNHGLRMTALEPFGAGSCLLIAGVFFAKPLWAMKILTVPDLFGVKFGKRAELLSALVLVPGYFGWIAVQIAALSGIVHLFFGSSVTFAMILVTLGAIVLACLGGMWSVALTDAVQMVFVGIIISILAYVVIKAVGNGSLGFGMLTVLSEAQRDKNVTQMNDAFGRLFSYLNIFSIAALGNLPGQDLAQRIFSAKSEKVAQKSCLIAGACYIVFGSISILLGFAARALFPEQLDRSVLPYLAKQLLSPGMTTLLILAIISIILSTMDSAMLATSSIISHNLIKPYVKNPSFSPIALCRLSIVFVGLASLLLALVGENSYALLEQSYAISLAGLFMPFFFALCLKDGNETAAIASMVVGMVIWVMGFFVDSLLVSELMAALWSGLTYFVAIMLLQVGNRKFKNFSGGNGLPEAQALGNVAELP